MTLQELHELTGKVLKERPELALARVEDCSEQTIKGIGQYKIDVIKEVVVLLDEVSSLFDAEMIAEGEWVCQLN